MTRIVGKYVDFNPDSDKPLGEYEWTPIEIPILRDDETVAELLWIKNNRLYVKTSSSRWLLSKDGGETWQVPRGPLPKKLKDTPAETFKRWADSGYKG